MYQDLTPSQNLSTLTITHINRRKIQKQLQDKAGNYTNPQTE